MSEKPSRNLKTQLNQYIQTINYFITITLHPACWEADPYRELDKYLKVVTTALTDNLYHGNLYLEVTEKAHIHFHGMGGFSVPENIAYPKAWITRKLQKTLCFGYISLRKRENEPAAQRYCEKEHDVMVHAFNFHRVMDHGTANTTRDCCKPDLIHDEIYEEVIDGAL